MYYVCMHEAVGVERVDDSHQRGHERAVLAVVEPVDEV